MGEFRRAGCVMPLMVRHTWDYKTLSYFKERSMQQLRSSVCIYSSKNEQSKQKQQKGKTDIKSQTSAQQYNEIITVFI